MTLTQSELDSFHDFASQILSRGGRDLCLEELISEWRARRGEAETLASVRRGVEDAEAGRVHELGEVDASIRSQLGFPTRGS